MEDYRNIIKLFYEEIWNKYNKSMIEKIIHEDFTFRASLGPVKTGQAEFASYVDFIHAALGEYECEIVEILGEGNKYFARMIFSGSHRGEFFGYSPNGKLVSWDGAAVFTFEDNMIRDLWVLGDVHGLLTQLDNNSKSNPQ